MIETDVGYQVEGASYWQGAGIAFTKWEGCVVGVGDSQREALEDALNGAADLELDLPDADVEHWMRQASKRDVHDECRAEIKRHAARDFRSEEEYEDWVWEQHAGCEVNVYCTIYYRRVP